MSAVERGEGPALLTAWICRFIRIMPIQLQNGLEILKQWEMGGKRNREGTGDRRGQEGREIRGDGKSLRYDGTERHGARGERKDREVNEGREDQEI